MRCTRIAIIEMYLDNVLSAETFTWMLAEQADSKD